MERGHVTGSLRTRGRQLSERLRIATAAAVAAGMVRHFLCGATVRAGGSTDREEYLGWAMRGGAVSVNRC